MSVSRNKLKKAQMLELVDRDFKTVIIGYVLYV